MRIALNEKWRVYYLSPSRYTSISEPTPTGKHIDGVTLPSYTEDLIEDFIRCGMYEPMAKNPNYKELFYPM